MAKPIHEDKPYFPAEDPMGWYSEKGLPRVNSRVLCYLVGGYRLIFNEASKSFFAAWKGSGRPLREALHVAKRAKRETLSHFGVFGPKSDPISSPTSIRSSVR